MKFLLAIVALAALAHAAPATTQTMEIGANGAVSGSAVALQNIPLVEIIVNLIKDVSQTVVPEAANVPAEVHPVVVVDEAVNTELVVVVDRPVSVVPGAPEVNPIDIMPVNPVAPGPAPEVPAPIVLPEPALIVPPQPAPIVLPQPAPIVVPQPAPAPVVLPEPTPVQVVDVPEAIVVPQPIPAEVVDPVQPVQVVEVAQETADAGSSQIINVMMSFIFGASGSLSSVALPSNVIPQIQPRV